MLMDVFWVLQVLDALLKPVDGIAQDLCSRLALAIVVFAGVAALGPFALIACTRSAIAPHLPFPTTQTRFAPLKGVRRVGFAVI